MVPVRDTTASIQTNLGRFPRLRSVESIPSRKPRADPSVARRDERDGKRLRIGWFVRRH
nr:hypothetical protein [Trichocoleus sp. FACHB-40]